MADAKQSASTQRNVAAVVAHPVRARCLTFLAERVASPNELKAELGVSIGDAAYHVKRLHELGAIELVDTRQVRGAVEHFYRAIIQPYLTDDEIGELTPSQRRDITEQACMLIFADATRSLSEGTLCERDDYYVSRVPMLVDEEGWQELNEAYSEVTQRIFDIKAASAKRMAKATDSKAIRTSTAVMFFEMPENSKTGR